MLSQAHPYLCDGARYRINLMPKRPVLPPSVLSDGPQPAPPITPAPLRLSYLVARLDRVLNQHVADRIKPHGLNVPQYTALSVLGRCSGLSNAQLARRTYVSPQGMNQVLDQLAQAGLIVRKQSATNGRILQIQLTLQGKRVLAACDVAVDALEADMLQTINATERKQMLHGLLACVHALHGGLETIKELEL